MISNGFSFLFTTHARTVFNQNNIYMCFYVLAFKSVNWIPVIIKRRNMFRDTILVCGIFWGMLLLAAKGNISKQRLWVQYIVDDYNSTMIPLKKLSVVTQSVCFVKCVRHQPGSSPCRAFHFRQIDGICELLPKDIDCMADNMTPGTTYLHLTDCGSMAPWRSINPNPGPLDWVGNANGALSLTSPMRGVRHVTRNVHKGLWLPGYGKPWEATFIGPDGLQIICRSNIQYINASEPVPYRWVSFSVGDPVPTTAIVAGYWLNGTPLYIVYMAGMAFGTLSSASYNTQSLQIEPQFSYSYRPGSLTILVRRE